MLNHFAIIVTYEREFGGEEGIILQVKIEEKMSQITLLRISGEKTEREIKEKIPFTIATKRIRYLGVYLPKETRLIHRKL